MSSSRVSHLIYVDLSVNPLSTRSLNSPLGHFNGDQRTPSLHQTDKNHGDSKTQSLTRPTTHAAFSTFSLLTIYSTRFLQHQKQTKYSMLQIKKTFFVVLLKRSFVIHLCCLKNIVLEKLTISRNTKRPHRLGRRQKDPNQIIQIPNGIKV